MIEEMTREQACDTLRNAAWLGTNEDRERIEKAVELLCGEPCEDAISRGVFEQVKWERDVAIEQLKELGYGFGEKPKTGHWILRDDINGQYQCDECGMFSGLSKFDVEEAGWKLSNFCSNCGAKMVEPQESDHKCHTCKHYTSGENDGSCGSYICKGYSNWERRDKE